MNLKSSFFIAAAVIGLASCDKYKTKVSDTGLKYQIHEHDDAARKAKIGDVISFNMILKTSDSVLRDTYKEKAPISFVLQEAPFKASFEEGLLTLSKGDSATFYVNSDTLFAKMMQPVPPFVKKGSDLVFTVKVNNLQTPEEFQKSQEQDLANQKTKDDKIISDFLAKNKINAQKSATGIYYVIEKEGAGETPKAGDEVKVHYEGKDLTGKTFDASKDKPFEFKAGMGMVIPGWDETLLSMKKGEKRKVWIPSGLAYGAQPLPGVGPNAVLAFDVELLEFKKGTPPPAPVPAPAPAK